MAKPAFNPQQPFDKQDGPKPKFDSSKSFDVPQEQGRSFGAPEAQAVLENFANEVTLGHLPQLQAGASKLFSKLVSNPADVKQKELEAQGFKVQRAPEDYEALKNANIQRLVTQERESPLASMIGKLGGLAGSIITTGAAGKALGIGNALTGTGRLAQAVGTGGVLGALQNPQGAEDEGDLELGSRAKGALTGALTGGVLQGGFEGIGKIAPKIAGALSTRASEKAVKALGGTKKEIQNLQARGQEKDLGRLLLDEGAIPIFGTPKRISERISGLKEKVGQEIGDLAAKAGDEKIIDASELAQKIMQSPKIASLAGTPGAEGLANKAEQTLLTLQKKGSLSLKEAQSLRQNVDNLINFSKTSDELRGIQGVLYEIRSGLRDAMTKAVPALKDPNRQFSLLSAGEKIVEGKMARDQANRAIGLTDTISGGAGGMIGATMGGPLGAAAGAGIGTAVNKFGRTFGSGLQARALDSASKIAASTPQLTAFARNNPMKFQVLVSQIMAPSVVAPKNGEFAILRDPEVVNAFKSNPELVNQVKDERLRQAIQELLGR